MEMLKGSARLLAVGVLAFSLGFAHGAEPATAKEARQIAWTGIVVHHSATAEGDVESFRRHHVTVRGWDDVGYHYVITRDGTVQIGRALTIKGAHAKNPAPSRNSTHIGICLVGDNDFTDAQLASLRRLISRLSARFDIKSVERHHEECPGDSLNVEGLL